jgi:hypothetical protein
MAEATPAGNKYRVINIDKSADEAMRFFKNRGFIEKLSQYEMIRSR